MAVTQTVEKSLSFVFSPLTLSPGIAVEGNVPDSQQYDIAANVYEPDYTNTNLVLRPSMLVSDPDGVIPEGNATLTNMRWTLLEKGTETAITSSTPGFTVAADGKLTVKRNCDGENPMTLRFEADYLDTRTGGVHHMVETRQVMCEGISQRPVLSLDTSGVLSYDPVRDGEKVRKVKARLTIGGKDVPVANRAFVWQKRDSDGVWADISATELMDYDVAVSTDGTELTVRLWLIGERIDIRCYAKYNPYGSPSSVVVDTRTPVETFSAVRQILRLKGQVANCPQRVKAGTRDVRPVLVVNDAKGVIPNPEAVLDVEWRTSTGVAAGTVTKSAVVARGANPSIPTSFLAKLYGGKLIPAFGVKEPLRALKTADGKILTDAQGRVLVAR